MTHPAYTVRPARPNDAPAILDLWREERSDHASTADRPQDVQRLLAESPGGLLVAAGGDGALLGVLIAAWDGWRGNMYRLAVRAVPVIVKLRAKRR